MDYVQTLLTVMPSACKLQRFEYGSPGNWLILEWLYTISLSKCKIKYCHRHFLRVILLIGIMEYYHEMLIDVIQYPDLRTDVFQCFREVGNAILLTLLMEQLMVIYVVVIFIYSNNPLPQLIERFKYASCLSCVQVLFCTCSQKERVPVHVE